MTTPKKPAARTPPTPRGQQQTAPHAASQSTRSTTSSAPPALSGRRNLKVRATAVGYYDNERKRVGDVFELESERAFSRNWMEYVEAHTPLKTTTSQQALNREHDQILGGTAAPAPPEGDNPLDA